MTTLSATVDISEAEIAALNDILHVRRCAVLAQSSRGGVAGVTGARMIDVIRLTVPMPPNLANARLHWRVKLRDKSAYWGTLNLMERAGAFPKAPYPTPERATIRARMFLGSQMDHDNAMARMKWVLDWLVASKYLLGDSPKHLSWQGMPEQTIKRDGNYWIELVITPLSAVQD